jgi:hypothetical protein
MERHNLSIKGSANFSGYVAQGCSMHSALSNEFVNLVYHASTNLVEPSDDIPVLDFPLLWKSELFLQFLDLMRPEKDITAYGSGWLVNDNKYLGFAIEPQDITAMEDALNGVVKEQSTLEDTRRLLLQSTKRFHHVIESVWKNGNGDEVRCCICDCRQFYFNRYCWQSAYLQHRDRLKTAFQSVKGKKKSSRRKRSSLVLQRQELQMARLRIKQQRGEDLRQSDGNSLYHVLTQEDESELCGTDD